MIKTSLFVLILMCFIQTPVFSFVKNYPIQTKKFGNTVYYQLTLESMFHENDMPKFEKKLIDLNAPFVFDEVDYRKGIIIVKMIRKAPYNDVKSAFDQIGLRITSELEIVK